MSSADPARSRTSFVTSRPVAVLMLFLAAVVFGYFSYGRLPVQLMPELTYPTLTVRTEYPGAAPEEVENDICRPIEEALGVIGGLRRLSSVSRAEVGDVVLEFGWDTDISEATQDVLERLDLVFMPEEASRPLILHYDPSLDPVMELSLSGSGAAYEGEGGLRKLRRLAELQVKRALEPVKGVAAVRVKGGLEEEIHVLLDEQRLRRTGISIQQVIERLREENINVAGGTIQEGRTEYLVRTLNEYENLRQIEKTIVETYEGRPVRIEDLGQVELAHKERQIATSTDGEESVQIEIYKEADANIVALAKRVRAVVGEEGRRPDEATERRPRGGAGKGGRDVGLAELLQREEGARLTVIADRSLFIESSIREVRNTALVGGGLAILILFLFLRSFRTTMIIAASIPISLLVTFAPLHILKVSLNVMSLGGLALGIGMLVDSSIVVLESIHRCREEGDGRVESAIRGVGEVRAAVLASTLTSIAVFFPMVFLVGVAGQAFGDLGLAVVVSLLASAAVALYFIPMLASRRGLDVGATAVGESSLGRCAAWRGFRLDLGRASLRTKLFVLPVLYWSLRLAIGFLLEILGKLLLILLQGAVWITSRAVAPAARRGGGLLAAGPLRVASSVLSGLQRIYPVALRWSLAHPLFVLGAAFLIFAGVWQLARSLDSELLPEVRQGEFTVEVALPVGTPLEQTAAVLEPVERAILAAREHIRSVILTVGYDPAQSERSDEGEHTARFKVLLEPSRRGPAREDEIVDQLRRRFAAIPDLKSRVSRPVLFSAKTPIELEIQGDDLKELRHYSERARALLGGLPELADVHATLREGAPEIRVVYDREQLTRLGLNIYEVARLVRDKIQGYEATRFNLVDRRIPIVVRLGEQDRETVADVEDLIVNPGGVRPIRLTAVADVLVGEGPSEVRRVDGQRVAVVGANIASGSLSAAVKRIEATMRGRLSLPAGMNFAISGQSEEWERSRSSLLLVLSLSIFLVYVIMAIQFESLSHPLVIMFTIPLAFVGTVLVLWLFDIPLSVVVFLGMIMLAGIVVNNAIVLVDYINQLRGRGLAREEAIVTAGSVRLRPILMTTATTVLGLTPMALGLGDGAEIRTPMAIAVISGLLSSTFLTLLVIPTLYEVIDRLGARLIAHRRRAES